MFTLACSIRKNLIEEHLSKHVAMSNDLRMGLDALRKMVSDARVSSSVSVDFRDRWDVKWAGR